MKFKIKRLWVVLLAFVVLLFASCDQKDPEKGYLTEEQVLEIVKGFSSTADYTKYSFNGTLNFLGFEDDLIPNEKRGKDKEFEDALDKYNSKSSSYYLRMPLHITEANWTYSEDDGADITGSTYYKIKSMLLTIGETLDKVYYYTNAEGDLIIRTFGANKALIIRESDIICHGKWNVTLKYNKDGYLVSEKFETINAHKDPDTKTCYGEATYTFA